MTSDENTMLYYINIGILKLPLVTVTFILTFKVSFKTFQSLFEFIVNIINIINIINIGKCPQK